MRNIEEVKDLTERLIELELKLASLLKALQDQRDLLKQIDIDNHNLKDTKWKLIGAKIQLKEV